MPAFILRFAGTRCLAGLYAAETQHDLFDLIDQETDPGDYEYAIIPEGFGIEFRKGEWTVKYRIGKGAKTLDRAFRKANSIYLTGELHYALTDGKDLRWRRLYED